MPEQGTHHFVMTCQKPQAGGGFAVATWSGNFTPQPEATRHDVYEWLREQYAREFPDLTHGVVLFFSLESNQL
ncbi:hypothetical protein DTL70_21115 [Streptomyces diacarni]|uniref:Uncharacterized protein n=1 Tax=Streptomyces diacarni TaxID=2800381 RepID=A0A367ETQ7_9ACTN|nr:hypothetical protein [Streptomyces diacarni]RCG20777.1 hypothetical protein DTL70_21115 [Streptomyces diacarni]